MSLDIGKIDTKKLKNGKTPRPVSEEELRKLYGIDAIEAYQKLVDDTTSVIEECFDKELKIATELDYIKWITNFLKEHESFDTNNIPKDITEEDRKNIDDLFIFYRIIHKYAHRKGLATSAFVYIPEENIHTVSYKDTNFVIRYFEDGTISLNLTEEKDIRFNYENIMDSVIKEELSKENDNPDFIKNLSEAFEGFDEAVRKDIEDSMRGNEDNISEIARLLLNADKGEERDQVLVDNFSRLQAEYTRIINKNKEANVLKKTLTEQDMIGSPEYIEWLMNFAKKNNKFDEKYSDKIDTVDKKNIDKLPAFFSIIAEYAYDKEVPSNFVPNGISYNLKYRGSVVEIGSSDNNIFVSLEDDMLLEDEYTIDFSDILVKEQGKKVISSVNDCINQNEDPNKNENVKKNIINLKKIIDQK